MNRDDAIPLMKNGGFVLVRNAGMTKRVPSVMAFGDTPQTFLISQHRFESEEVKH